MLVVVREESQYKHNHGHRRCGPGSDAVVRSRQDASEVSAPTTKSQYTTNQPLKQSSTQKEVIRYTTRHRSNNESSTLITQGPEISARSEVVWARQTNRLHSYNYMDLHVHMVRADMHKHTNKSDTHAHTHIHIHIYTQLKVCSRTSSPSL